MKVDIGYGAPPFGVSELSSVPQLEIQQLAEPFVENWNEQFFPNLLGSVVLEAMKMLAENLTHMLQV